MTKSESSYKRVSLEDATTDAQVKRSLSTLDEPWQPQKARFQMAGILAIGILILFALTIACSGTVIMTLVFTSAVLGKAPSSPKEGIEQMINFVVMLLPYIATPLGVALGYFFREGNSTSK